MKILYEIYAVCGVGAYDYFLFLHC